MQFAIVLAVSLKLGSLIAVGLGGPIVAKHSKVTFLSGAISKKSDRPDLPSLSFAKIGMTNVQFILSINANIPFTSCRSLGTVRIKGLNLGLSNSIEEAPCEIMRDRDTEAAATASVETEGPTMAIVLLKSIKSNVAARACDATFCVSMMTYAMVIFGRMLGSLLMLLTVHRKVRSCCRPKNVKLPDASSVKSKIAPSGKKEELR